MCDCRISASKWDLSVYHEGAAALQLSEISRSDGHNHYLRFPAVMVTIKAVTLSNIFENFYSLWACFCCLCFVLSCHLPPPSLLPSLSFSLSLSLVFVSFLFPFWQSSGTDHLFIRPEAFCSEMTYLYQSQRIDFITVLTVVLAGGGENGSIID